MPIMAKAPESNFNPAPEGLHSAVCADVVELGTEVNQFNGGLQEKVRIVWQLDAMDPQTQRRYEASQKYTLSLHEKAKLTGHLEAWRGRKFTAEELTDRVHRKLRTRVLCDRGTDQHGDARVESAVLAGRSRLRRAHDELVRRSPGWPRDAHRLRDSGPIGVELLCRTLDELAKPSPIVATGEDQPPVAQ